MKLRSGTEVVQIAHGGIAQNLKTSQAITEHNSGSPLLMLPQELKNRIYYFVCGGQVVHILQNDRNHNHVHGDHTFKLSHATCIERTPETQIQQDFDSADPETVAWNIVALDDRHGACYEPPPKQKKRGRLKPNQLSLTLLRSCRQIYLEANKVHYAHNTFAFNCNDILERFVRARVLNKQNLAIRSLYVDVIIAHSCYVDTWSDCISRAVLKRLKSVRQLYLSLGQNYCICTVEASAYKGSDMTERQAKMLKMFRKLPLKEATLLIDDSMFLQQVNPDFISWDYYNEMEELYRWTMKQKQDFSKEVRDALFRRGDIGKGKEK